MAIGAENIMNKSFDKLLESVNNNPGYSVLVVGYSLGRK